MNKTILASGIFIGVFAIILGAFGAHGLKGHLTGDEMKAFETGVEYQMYHALLILILGNMNQIPENGKKVVFQFIIAGILCFSFSLYLLSLGSLWKVDLAFLGIATPIGGILLLTGWILLAYRLFKPFNQSIY